MSQIAAYFSFQIRQLLLKLLTEAFPFMMTASSISISVIDDFMKHYPREFMAHEVYAKKARDICKEQLQEAGIPAIVTYRAKEPDRLRMKLEDRAKSTIYKDEKAIRADIQDLAGARIAVYYPDQKLEVKSILLSAFGADNVKELKPKPRKKTLQETKEKQMYERRFFEYKGDHYHVKIPPHKLEKMYRDQDFVAEIQVVTVISSAWSQVEHDIVYKKITGTPSKDEHRILDQFNGLVHLGESLLEQLYETHRARINAENSKFLDENDLRSYLQKWISQNPDRVDSRVDLGPVRSLFALLQVPALELSTPKALARELDQVSEMTELLSSHGSDNAIEGELAYTSSFSLFVMKDLYDRFKLAKEAKQQPRPAISQSIEARARLEIIASTAMWIDELFRGREWEGCLFDGEGSIPEQVMNGLAWLLRLKDADMSVVSIWLDRRTPTQPAMSRINALWDWFDNHGNKSVQFAFNLSRFGMLKDPTKEAAGLQTIGAYLEYVGDLSTGARNA